MNINMHSQTDETTVNFGNFDIGLLETICVKSVDLFSGVNPISRSNVY